jgi:alpha-tubulin suppressor-like RCC1 family protein
MSTLNTAALLLKLQEQVATSYIGGSFSVDNILSLALSTKVLGDVNIISAQSANDLPNLAYHDSPSGMLYYINDVGVFAISSGVNWLTLDGRLLRQDTIFGDALSWGCNSSGQLGDRTVTNRSSPVSVVGGFNDWCQISAGDCHGLGLRSNGTAWAWGNNSSGRLGDNSTVNKSSPVSVVGGFTDWCQVSAGNTHNLGVRTNGTAWAWGPNGGALGDNSTTDRSSPVSVVGGFTDWCQVSASSGHSLGVRTNCTAWAWGSNGFVQLGDNTNTNRSSPVSVVGGFTDWCQVSAGSFHSLGVRTNGTAWAWGWNSSGRLGDNSSITARSSPVSVVGGFTDWCQVSAGGGHSIGVRTNGTAWAWGGNNNGVLGTCNLTSRSSPVSVVGGFTDWCQVSAGASHNLGLRTNGTAWAWGYNGKGELGDNTTVAKSSPVQLVGGFTDWYQISAKCFSLGLRAKC